MPSFDDPRRLREDVYNLGTRARFRPVFRGDGWSDSSKLFNQSSPRGNEIHGSAS